jgi:hypothetical protein
MLTAATVVGRSKSRLDETLAAGSRLDVEGLAVKRVLDQIATKSYKADQRFGFFRS